jgi:ribosomal protein S18 acetylase RimI-like enzyme
MGKQHAPCLADNHTRRAVTRQFTRLLHCTVCSVLLTVLKINTSAIKFYTEKLGYVIDETSPSMFGETAGYEILSKMFAPKS